MAKWHCLRSLYGTTVESIHKKWLWILTAVNAVSVEPFQMNLEVFSVRRNTIGLTIVRQPSGCSAKWISNSYITSQHKKLIYADEDTELWAKSRFCNTSNIVQYLLSNSCQRRYEVKRSAFLIENPWQWANEPSGFGQNQRISPMRHGVVVDHDNHKRHMYSIENPGHVVHQQRMIMDCKYMYHKPATCIACQVTKKSFVSSHAH